MGTQSVDEELSGERYRLFMRSLLKDVQALEQMLSQGMIETGVRRIGAEQELFLVDKAWRPAPRSNEVLDALDDEAFTTELARFNLEFNLDPLTFGGDCLSKLEQQINTKVARLREVTSALGLEALMTGILPTLTVSDLDLENMTRRPRYFALNNALMRLRGRAYEFRIRGTDELLINHDTVMPEACNTSFQVHFQAGPDEFAKMYNIAQAATAPVLAAAANSPLLFGKRLWHETRIAVFQQAIDTRSTSHQERTPRVSFGRDWLQRSALEIFQDDISRFRVLLGADIDEDPFADLRENRPPNLRALRLHNGTVYRWNRACYGIWDGKAHLRIENRALPSGPTVIDEIANAAFWFGLMSGCLEEYGDITEVLDFDAVRTNFIGAARLGLAAHLTWVGGKALPARQVIRQFMLPLAREGLQHAGIDRADIDRYLGIVEQRVASGRTGAQWALQSINAMRQPGTRFERMCALTAATAQRQKEGKPVHSWKPARLEESGGWKQHFLRVEQFMTTDVHTVHEDDLVDLVAAMMQWQNIRYVPVEDDNHKLVGLVSARVLLRLVGADLTQSRGEPTPVSELMHRDVICVSPDTPTFDAIDLMREHAIGCLPVVKEGTVVGMVTERNFMQLAAHLLTRALKD